MPFNQKKQLQNQARWIFVQKTKMFLIQAAKLVQKEAQFNMLIKTHVEELAQQSLDNYDRRVWSLDSLPVLRWPNLISIPSLF